MHSYTIFSVDYAYKFIKSTRLLKKRLLCKKVRGLCPSPDFAGPVQRRNYYFNDINTPPFV